MSTIIILNFCTDIALATIISFYMTYPRLIRLNKKIAILHWNLAGELCVVDEEFFYLRCLMKPLLIMLGDIISLVTLGASNIILVMMIWKWCLISTCSWVAEMFIVLVKGCQSIFVVLVCIGQGCNLVMCSFDHLINYRFFELAEWSSFKPLMHF